LEKSGPLGSARATFSRDPCRLSINEAAAFVGVSASKYRALERRELMPAARVVDGRRLYDREQVHAAFKRLPTTSNGSGEPMPPQPHNDSEDHSWDDLT